MVFEAVARLGSVSYKGGGSASPCPADGFGPAQELAEALELQLFVQRGPPAVSHARRAVLLSSCEELIDLLLRTETRLSALRGGEGETLRIGAASGARQLAARMLASFCARHPGIQASLHVANCSQLIERLAAQEDDLYILTLPDNAPGVKTQLLATESLRLYCGPSDALASLKSISLSDVAGARFVVGEPGAGTRRMLQALLEHSGHELRIRAELGSDEAVAEAAAAGLGIALLPVAVAAPFVAAGFLAVIRADIPDLQLNWHLVRPERAALSPAALLFVREAQAYSTREDPVQSEQPI